jgi:UDP-N-acetylmuramyl pentapeptide phosphotransferase/UDP-N-acetylglucosamine-1-phosphate transferase
MVGVLATSWVCVGLLRRYAIARAVLDHPTERSSHELPTPRGGGAGVVIASVMGYLVLARGTSSDWVILLGLAALIPTALAGWLDDHGSLPVLPRVSAHVISALLILPLALGSLGTTGWTWLIAAGWLIATVSAINVVNFIDGIDGLIGLQAVIFGIHLAALAGLDSPGGMVGVTLAAGAAGFLLWNWPPARIFLGDVGSGALAVLGVVGGVLVWRTGEWPFIAVFLPLFPIFLDASVTIARRARRGLRLSEAHRSHLYQRLANEAGWGHARVTLLYGAAAAAGTITVLVAEEGQLPASAAYSGAIAILGFLLDRSIENARRPSAHPHR